MLTISFILICAALIITILHGVGKLPLWPAVLLICVTLLIQYIPVK